MDQPTAEQALRQLEPLVGEWTFEATWPDGKPWPGGGRVHLRMGNGEWKLWREGEPFSQRFRATLSDEGNTITGRWEFL